MPYVHRSLLLHDHSVELSVYCIATENMRVYQSRFGGTVSCCVTLKEIDSAEVDVTNVIVDFAYYFCDDLMDFINCDSVSVIWDTEKFRFSVFYISHWDLITVQRHT